MTDQEIERVIREMASKELIEEIEWKLDVDRELEDGETYDFLDAWIEVFQQADQDMPRNIILNIGDIGIKIGIYKEVSDEELKDIQVSSGRKYDITRKGKKYVFECMVPKR